MPRVLPRFFRAVLFLLVLLLVLAGCGTGQERVIVVTATPGPTQPPPTATATTEPTTAPTATQIPPTAVPPPTQPPALTVSQVVDKLRPSTALVQVQMATDFGGTGSAWVYDASGLVVTNAHVVTGSALIKVHFQGTDRWLSARVVGISPCDDLAVLQVDGSTAPAVAVAAADSVKVGDEVVAVGYPKASVLGTDLQVTRGVVSRIHAQVDKYDDTIQTDAAINPGSSGGPLVNMKGEVVGVNTASLRGATGINFAIAMSHAKPVIDQLAQGKKLNYMGWNLVANDADLAASLKLASAKGMVVAGVDSGSPAAKAGLKPLDIIFNAEDIELTSDAQVCDILRSHTEGQALRLDVIRGTQHFAGEVNGTGLQFVKDLAGGTQAKPTAASQPPPQPQPTQVPPKPVGGKYGAPTLTSPANGSSYVCFRPLILSWSGPALGPNDWYLIESAKQDHPNDWGAMTDWTKDTTVTLNPEKGFGGCSAPWWGGLGVYLWRVRIITGDRNTHTIQGNASPPSQPFTITYG